ncbi:response regulator transcription factor [Williamsia sp. 1135]|uniref:response regulator transcription factor n=1 Tax=Williamsia sp. 1135 TaxID=1889262 RepID=UPI000A0FBB75|nr:response regulator transcription factor [Williamsia sp. 1135]ORM32244.1 DNA-binding response regulator [Williamsia sp. 1135]
MIRVLIVDDHPVVREGLQGMLESEVDLEVVGDTGSGDEAILLAADLHPDVVLMDLRMPGTDGVAATVAIRSRLPEVNVVVLTTYDSDADILRAIEAGAAGYLLKDTSRALLADAIRSAARGETVLTPAVAGRLLGHSRRPALTEREVGVLQCVARGMTNADIGAELHISEATVKTHLIRTFNKLDVSDRTAAVTTAMTLGYLT